MVPNARYSIWLDGKLELVVDPYQILERYISVNVFNTIYLFILHGKVMLKFSFQSLYHLIRSSECGSLFCLLLFGIDMIILPVLN